MGTIDYESLIAEHHTDVAERAEAERLAEIARNLQTLRELSEAEINAPLPVAEGDADEDRPTPILVTPPIAPERK